MHPATADVSWGIPLPHRFAIPYCNKASILQAGIMPLRHNIIALEGVIPVLNPA